MNTFFQECCRHVPTLSSMAFSMKTSKQSSGTSSRLSSPNKNSCGMNKSCDDVMTRTTWQSPYDVMAGLNEQSYDDVMTRTTWKSCDDVMTRTTWQSCDDVMTRTTWQSRDDVMTRRSWWSCYNVMTKTNKHKTWLCVNQSDQPYTFQIFIICIPLGLMPCRAHAVNTW